MSYGYLDYFSEAYNGSALASGVSPQTGAFQATLTLASVSSGVQNPVGFSLSLMIGIQSAVKSRAETTARKVSAGIDNTPLNASLNIPYIDTSKLKIFFSSGASEELTLSGDTYSMLYHRLDDVKINRVLIASSSPEIYWYKVSYKGGVVEYYNHLGCILKMASAAGHTLDFKYDSATNRCIEISSETSGKITITYNEQNAFTVTKINPGMPDLVTRVFTVRKYRGSEVEQAQKLYPEDCIESVGLPNDNDHRYRFEYRVPVDNLPEALYSITTPFGAKQAAKYTTVPYGKADDRENFVAVVNRLEVSNNIPEGEQSESLTQLSYTDYDYVSGGAADARKNNFTGYESSSTYRPISGIDNCIRKTGDYRYSVTETINIPGLTVERVRRTYNRFHLLEEVVVTQDSAEYYKTTTSYVYPITPDKDISGQSKKFSLWTSCTTKFQLVNDGQEVPNASREEVQSREFDDYGNLMSNTATSGIVTTNIYYPADPAATTPPKVDCPAAPNGIPCYLEISVTSPNQTAEIKPAPKVQAFTYISITGNPYVVNIDTDSNQPSVDFSVTPYMVLLKTLTIDNQLMGTYSYYSPPVVVSDPLLAGALLEESSTSAGRTNKARVAWSLRDEKTTLERGVEYSSTIVVNQEESREVRPGGRAKIWLGSGQVAELYAPNDAMTKFEYNNKGELVRKTLFFGTVYAEVEQFEFILWSKMAGQPYYGYRNILKYRKNGVATDYGLDRDMQVALVINPNVTEPNCLAWSRYRSDGTLFAQTVFDRSVSYEIERAISNVTTNAIKPMVASSLNADGSAPWTSVNPVANIVKNSMGASPVKYFSELNRYGLTDKDGYIETLTYPSGEEEVVEVTLNKNTYDGFGRLVTTSDVIMVSGPTGEDVEQNINKTTYNYDNFDRVLTEKSYVSSEGTEGWSERLIQTISYTYSQHIPSMYLPVEISCLSEPFSGSTPLTTRSIMLAKREYDGFARLISQEAPGELGPPATKIKELYTYADTMDDQPSNIQKDRGSIGYQYNQLTGLLESIKLNNGTGSAQPPATNAEFEYDDTTKLLKKEKVCVASDDTLLNQNTYSYNSDEQVVLVECSIPAVSEGIYTASYAYTKLQGAIQTLDIGFKASSAMLSEPPQSLWRVAYVYNKIGQLSRVYFTPDNDAAKTILVDVVYDSRDDGYSRGDIRLLFLCEATPNPEGTAWLSLAVDFYTNSMGGEKGRDYSDLNMSQFERFEIKQRFHRNLNLAGRKISSSPETQYSYLGQGAGMPLETSLAFGTSGNEVERNVYAFDGLSRLSKITSAFDGKIETYTYYNDRATAFLDKQGVAQAYAYDTNGNVLSDNQQSTLRYNALNGIGSFQRKSATDKTEFFYTPDGKLYQILDKASGRSICYLYEGETVVGELEAINGVVQARAFFVRLGDDILGRYITILATKKNTVTQHYFDWYITDAAGSLIGVRRYTPGSLAGPKVHYYKYSDYGERSEWIILPEESARQE